MDKKKFVGSRVKGEKKPTHIYFKDGKYILSIVRRYVNVLTHKSRIFDRFCWNVKLRNICSCRIVI